MSKPTGNELKLNRIKSKSQNEIKNKKKISNYKAMMADRDRENIRFPTFFCNK